MHSLCVTQLAQLMSGNSSIEMLSILIEFLTSSLPILDQI